MRRALILGSSLEELEREEPALHSTTYSESRLHLGQHAVEACPIL